MAKMSKSEAGHLGGLVTSVQPQDLLKGNPEARKLSAEMGTRRASRPVILREIYVRCPQVITLLAEHMLDVLADEGSLYSPVRKAELAAHRTILQLREISWQKLDEGSHIFEKWLTEFEIGLAAFYMLEVARDGSRKNSPKQAK